MCAVFGLIDYGKVFKARQREKILHSLSLECEVRGTDAAGYAFNTGGKLKISKRPVPASKLWVRLYEAANIILGHTRMATQGDKKFNCNNHPFPGKCQNTKFALAHNGVIYNDSELRKEHKIPQTKVKTDSYIAVQMLEKLGELNAENLAKVSEEIRGSFVFTVLDEQNNSYFVRGDDPLALYNFKAGFHIYASTENILENALTALGLAKYPHEKISTICGDILKIDRNGKLSKSYFRSNVMEYLRCYNWDCYPDYSELNRLKMLAEKNGYFEDCVELLLDYGYSALDIEDLICIPEAFENAVSEVLCEYGYCNEM